MTTNEIIDVSHETYVKEIELTSKELNIILLRVLAEMSSKGVLVNDPKKMAELENTIRQALKDAGYSKATDKLFETLPKIEESNESYYSKEDLAVKPLLNADILKFLKEKLIFDLRGQGAHVHIVKPLEDLIRENVFLNRTFREAADLLKIKLVDKPYLLPYADNVALSALSQYNGSINNLVRIKYDLKWFNYIGSVIEETRPVCDHLRDLGNRSISEDELQETLNEFCPNGHPSKELITYTTVNDVKKTREKGSGMIEGTTFDNFTQLAGGHRCRHDVKWTRFPKK